MSTSKDPVGEVTATREHWSTGTQPVVVEQDWTTGEGPPAYRAFKGLGVWLSVGDHQVSDMLRIARMTADTWKQDEREPRPETARPIYECHAVVDSLRRRLKMVEFQMWLGEGRPSRRERVLSGGLTSLDRDVHAVVFEGAAGARPHLGWALESTAEPVVPKASGGTPCRAGRRPRSARRA